MSLLDVIIVGVVSAPFILLFCYLIHKAIQLVNKETNND